ncbi:MAG: mechanosensitive ion channel family protein [Polyangiaceae bacterium]
MPDLPPSIAAVGKLTEWTAGGLYALVWLLVAILVRSVLKRWLEHVHRQQKTEVTEVLAGTVPRPAGIATFLAGTATGLRFLTVPETRLLEIHRLLAFAMASVCVGLVLRVAVRSIDAYGRVNPALKSSAGIGRAVAWVVSLAVEAVLASDLLGLSLAPALTAFGVGSLAVALALQDTLSNFFSGVYVILDKPVRPGDFVRVEPSYEGYVASIGWRSTQLRTLTNNIVIIPNGMLAKAVITNYALPSPHIASSVRVDVAADADVERVAAVLGEIAQGAAELPAIASDPKPGVSLSPGFVDGYIGFTVYYNVVSFGDQSGVQNVLRMRVAAAFKKAGIALRKV